MTMCASASAAAAPPMSFFMISMALGGLMSRPPVSKQMPLPTSVTRGAEALPQVRSISRGGRSLARPTAWIIGKFSLRRSSPTMQLTLAPWRSGKQARGLLELLGAHVARRRVDEVAAQPHAVDDRQHALVVGALGHLQPRNRLPTVALSPSCSGGSGRRRDPRLPRPGRRPRSCRPGGRCRPAAPAPTGPAPAPPCPWDRCRGPRPVRSPRPRVRRRRPAAAGACGPCP